MWSASAQGDTDVIAVGCELVAEDVELESSSLWLLFWMLRAAWGMIVFGRVATINLGALIAGLLIRLRRPGTEEIEDDFCGFCDEARTDERSSVSRRQLPRMALGQIRFALARSASEC